MASSINTDVNIYDLRYGGKMAVAGKKTYHPYIAIYVELHILLFLCGHHYPGRVAYLFLSKKTQTVLDPWSSLTSYSGRRAYYGIE